MSVPGVLTRETGVSGFLTPEDGSLRPPEVRSKIDTQAEAAALLQVDGRTVRRWLEGTRPTPKVAVERLRTWAYALDQTAQAIIMGMGVPAVLLLYRRTWEWRNQNPLDYPTISTRIWKNRPKRALAISIAWQPFPNENDPPQGGSIPRNLGPRDQGLRCREHQSIYIDPLIRHETNHGVASDTASAKKDAISRSST
jgi:hypothetical protein